MYPDYLVLELLQGRLVFSYQLGSGPARLHSSKLYNDNSNHTVRGVCMCGCDVCVGVCMCGCADVCAIQWRPQHLPRGGAKANRGRQRGRGILDFVTVSC